MTEEEGARFRVPCLGSRLMTGAVDAETARGLADDDGVTLAEAMTAAGADASLLAPDENLLGDIGVFVELPVEQGRAPPPMVPPGPPATSPSPHSPRPPHFALPPRH